MDGAIVYTTHVNSLKHIEMISLLLRCKIYGYARIHSSHVYLLIKQKRSFYTQMENSSFINFQEQ